MLPVKRKRCDSAEEPPAKRRRVAKLPLRCIGNGMETGHVIDGHDGSCDGCEGYLCQEHCDELIHYPALGVAICGACATLFFGSDDDDEDEDEDGEDEEEEEEEAETVQDAVAECNVCNELVTTEQYAKGAAFVATCEDCGRAMHSACAAACSACQRAYCAACCTRSRTDDVERSAVDGLPTGTRLCVACRAGDTAAAATAGDGIVVTNP